MVVKCPVCGSEHDLVPGKYQCTCGAKFFVDGKGEIITGTQETADSRDLDASRTIPPRPTHDDTAKVRDAAFDPDKTVPNIRIRRERGELQVGDVVLNRYELLEKLGSGVMGVVFKCRDRVSRVEYAVKMVPPELARDADAMEEIRENFQLIHGLKHPNIASVDFLDRDEYGAYFLIMEYAPGESLSQWIKRKRKTGRPALREVAKIVKQIAAALDYAHGQKILHRDVKPANVMIDEQGNVKVLDFGLASKVRNTMTALSVNPANTSGTPNYLSPEQFKGKYPTPASDQYALGVLTYQMLAGHLPFDSDDLNMLHIIVAREKPELIDGVPDAVNACLQKVLAKDPKDRYASCSDFAAALGAADGAPAAAADEPSPRKRSRRLWWWLGGATLVVALVVTVAIIISGGNGPRGVSSSSGSDKMSREAAAPSGGTSKTEARRLAEERHRIEERRPDGDLLQDEKHDVVENLRQDAERRQSLPNGDRVLELSEGVSLELVKVEAGTFTMGARDGENDYDEKEHQVTLTKDFYIGKTEVTQKQWKAVMGNDPSKFKGDDLPVEMVSWRDAMAFCKKLNDSGRAPDGWKFTLPTEAQWEYACRAGTTTALNNGKNLTDEKYDCENLNEVAWYDYKNKETSTHVVGQKRPNEWGLYDMHGNVLEWCRDWYGSYGGDTTDPTGPATGSHRVSRGGSWCNSAGLCRSACRNSNVPGRRDFYTGFRLALVQVK